jgi:DNA-binding CsgD family transcriptional regulator
VGSTPDVVGIIEAAYRVEVPAETWLGHTLEVLRPALDQGMGCSAFLYDASDPTKLRVHTMCGASAPNDEAVMRAMERSSPDRVAWVFRTQACRTASEGPDWANQPAAKLFRTWGIEDILFVNGLDASGIGCFFTAKLSRRAPVARTVAARWSRIAAHLGAGYRLQRRLTLAASEAVLTPSGKLEHAEGEARDADARDALRRAVVAVERARGKLRRSAPHEAVETWRASVSARWSLLDQFERDGKRFIVARRNDVPAPGPELLSLRERQVLSLVAMGHHTKLVAYELGISPSTVRVLLTRACRKLGVKTRAEAIARLPRG